MQEKKISFFLKSLIQKAYLCIRYWKTGVWVSQLRDKAMLCLVKIGPIFVSSPYVRYFLLFSKKLAVRKICSNLSEKIKLIWNCCRLKNVQCQRNNKLGHHSLGAYKCNAWNDFLTHHSKYVSHASFLQKNTQCL